ncbi:MAG: PAS domain S-box protein [Mariprofundales bacterium]|nr:PAS domain S-box protein [Mariprofundales bacterium]
MRTSAMIRQWLNRQGLGQSIQIFSLLLIVLTSTILGINNWQHEKTAMLEATHNLEQHDALNKLHHLKMRLHELRTNARMLAELPPINGIMHARAHGSINPLNNNSEQIWKQQLTQIFIALAKNHPGFVSVRLIDLSNDGMELVRIDQNVQGITVITKPKLQHKNHRDYLQEAIKAAAQDRTKTATDRVYLSNITLNREHGRIQVPHLPVIRAVKLILNDDGQPLAAIVINRDARSLLAMLRKGDEGVSDNDFLLNADGEILTGGAQPQRAFSFELGGHYRIEDALPGIGQRWRQATTKGLSIPILLANRFVLVFALPLDADQPQRRLLLLETTTDQSLPLSTLLRRNLLYFVLMLLIGGLLAILVSRRLTRPLRQLTRSAKAMAQGHLDGELPLNAEGELGELARAFKIMIAQILAREQELAQINYRLDQQVQTHSANLQALFESSFGAIFSMDEDGTITDCNNAMTILFGYETNALIGHNIQSLLDQPSQQKIHKYIQHHRQPTTSTTANEPKEVRCIHRFGDIIPCLLALNVVHLPEDKNQFVGILLDITTHKVNENHIRKLSMAVEQNPAAIIITNAHGTIEYVNDAFTTISGYSSQEALGSNPRLLQSGLTTKATYHQMWTTLLQGKVWRGEIQNRNKDGSLIWNHSAIAPIIENNAITNFVSVQEDITQQKAMMTELEAARDKAERAAHDKVSFLNTMSHEIRTPLNTVLGMGQLLEETPLNSKQRVFVNSLNRTGHHLLNLINNILDFSRLGEGKLTLNTTAFEPRELASEVLDMMHHPANDKGIKLLSTLSQSIPEVVHGDKLRLKQVLVNLIGNALKFTSEGAVQLQITTKQDDPARITFSVQDSGPGIAANQLHRIFNTFTQSEQGNSRVDGSGLGLSISQKLVQLMDGQLEVESTLGQGSNFFFTITLPAISDQRQLTRASQSTIELPPLRILACDDNTDNLELLRLFLGGEEYHQCFHTARNGNEAIQAFMDGSFDLILMDLEMPIMDGITATRRIRALEAERGADHTPIIMLTAHTITTQTPDDRALFDSAVFKPINKQLLLQTLAAATRHGGHEGSHEAIERNAATPAWQPEALDEGVLELLPGYLSNQRQRLSDMEQALADGDFNTIRIAGHSIKGTGSSYGLPQLSALGATIETAASAEEANQLSTLLQNIDSVLTKAEFTTVNEHFSTPLSGKPEVS